MGGAPALFAHREKAAEVYRVASQGLFWQGEVEWLAKDGSHVPVFLRGGPVKNEAGESAGYLGIGSDLRRYRKMSKDIAESELLLKQLISFIPDALLAIDSAGRVIAWNRAIEEMTGVAAEEMLGKGDYEYALPFYGERRPLLVDLALSRKIPAEIEKKYTIISKTENWTVVAETALQMPKGQEMYLWGKASPLLDTEGNVIGAVETIRDITDKKKAEKNTARGLPSADFSSGRDCPSALICHRKARPLHRRPPAAGVTHCLRDC